MSNLYGVGRLALEGGAPRVLDPGEIPELRARMQERAEQDRHILEVLRTEVRPLKTAIRRIAPRSATTMSLVASDGGNNKIQFDPFLMQIVRVVDSFGQQLCLDVVSPTTDTDELSGRQFKASEPSTALGFRFSFSRNCGQVQPIH